MSGLSIPVHTQQYKIYYKQQEKIKAQLLHNTEVLLSQTVMGDETWVQHFKPKFHQQSTELHHATPPKKKKFKCTISKENHCQTVEVRKVLFCELILDHYTERLQSLNAWLL